MYDEAVSFFEHIIRKDRPVREILFADYDFLNKPLAKFYGVTKEIKSDRRRGTGGGRERLPSRRHAAPGRGADRHLGAAAHQPGEARRLGVAARAGHCRCRRRRPDAGSIPADDKLFGGLSVREKLEEHKRNATCANCHMRIDPLGFPLEHYDSTGRWREKYSDGKDDLGLRHVRRARPRSRRPGSAGLFEDARTSRCGARCLTNCWAMRWDAPCRRPISR